MFVALSLAGGASVVVPVRMYVKVGMRGLSTTINTQLYATATALV